VRFHGGWCIYCVYNVVRGRFPIYIDYTYTVLRCDRRLHAQQIRTCDLMLVAFGSKQSRWGYNIIVIFYFIPLYNVILYYIVWPTFESSRYYWVKMPSDLQTKFSPSHAVLHYNIIVKTPPFVKVSEAIIIIIIVVVTVDQYASESYIILCFN